MIARTATGADTRRVPTTNTEGNLSRNRALWGAALSGVILITAACGSDSDDDAANEEDTTTTAAAAPADAGECTADTVGGSLTVSIPFSSRTLDPFNGGGNTAEQGGTELQAIYDKLVRFDPATGEFIPHMAESLEPNEDYSVWTLTLRDGVTFGNGDPVDAAAVKASMDRHLNPDGGSALLAAAAQIGEVAAPDPSTVVITLREPWASFPSQLAGAFGLVQNTKVVEAMGQEAFAANPEGAGAGPYEVARYAPGESIELVAKDDYWGGPVCIEELTFSIISQNQTAYDALKNGEVDAMVLGRDPQLLDEARNDMDGFESYGALQIGGDLLLINSGADGYETPGADVRVRQAIAAAIDPEVVNQRAYGGVAKISTGLIPPDATLYEPTDGPEYDPDAASALVEEVKEETGWDGSIRMSCNNTPVTSEACISIKALLDSVGFQVDLNTQRSATEISTLVRVDKDFDLAMWGLSAHEENLWNTLNQYRTGARNNAGNFADPAMDEALTQLQNAATVDESNEALAAVQEVWTEQVPGVPLTAFEPSLIWRDGINGIYFNTNVVAFFDKAFLDE